MRGAEQEALLPSSTFTQFQVFDEWWLTLSGLLTGDGDVGEY